MYAYMYSWQPCRTAEMNSEETTHFNYFFNVKPGQLLLLYVAISKHSHVTYLISSC